jgi:trk system potassium uptake protein TrkA
MGARVAHLFAFPSVLDYLDVAPGFGLVMLRPPDAFVGRTIGQLDLPTKHQLSPIALRRGDRVVVNPHRDEKIAPGDQLILIGRDAGLAQLVTDVGRST